MRKLKNACVKETPIPPAGQSLPHESAILYVTGKARFVDDNREPAGCLYAYPVLSKVAHGILKGIDASSVMQEEGIVAVLTHEDIPGQKDIGPVFSGDPLLVENTIHYLGQPVALVIATQYDKARKAARQVEVLSESLPPLLDADEAIAKADWIRPPHRMAKGQVDFDAAEYRLTSTLQIGGQEHFYLEGQIAVAEPCEDGGMQIITSSQHPSEVQNLVAEVLGIPFAAVTVEMRRMGGGFGGKETQAAQWACLAALAAFHTGQPAKCRLKRSDDMLLTGKRHPFTHRFTAGFTRAGVINHLQADIYGHCGYSPDLSDAIVDRAMFHSAHAYQIANMSVTGYRVRLNTQSHTAFRGFGGPQGMLLAETLMDDVAYRLGLDPLDVRLTNLAKASQVTHFGQTLDASNLETIIRKLEHSACYRERRQSIEAFNCESPVIKRGIALTPVKFGISFTAQHLNQAGALIHLYTDGSVHLNHGGTEMGQGLNTKVAQIVATALGVGMDDVQVTATRTDKVPNTSPTAASSGTDLNGMAALNACETLKARLIKVAVEHFGFTEETVVFSQGQVRDGHNHLPFAELIQKAYLERVSLSATGFYKTPKIHYDRETASGRPFFYFAEGAAVAEVELDTLTGENRVTRVDVLHDVGKSINPALDLGQIEGAFIQGMGWLTTEKLAWNDKGQLLTSSPATYKIPSIGDTPGVFRVELFESENPEATVFRSKAVGEPPFMLAISVHCALRHAIACVAKGKEVPRLNAPATCETLLDAVFRAKSQSNDQGENVSC